MRDQETDRGEWPINHWWTFPFSSHGALSFVYYIDGCLGSGISSLVGGFDSKELKCGAGSSLSTSSGSREGDPDFRSLLYGGRFLSYQECVGEAREDWIERRCLCLFFIDRIPIIFTGEGDKGEALTRPGEEWE